MITLASVEDVKRQIDVEGTSYDAAIYHTCRAVTNAIEHVAGHRFFPETKIQYLDYRGGTVVRLRDPLLSVSAFEMSTDNGATYSLNPSASDYWLSDGAEYGKTPYRMIVANPNGSYPSLYGGRRSLKLTGQWGWHRDYANAWGDTGDTVQDSPLTASATTLTVADADGVDDLGITPRFAIGQLLRIESEFVAVVNVNTTTNVLTIKRAMNGSTAAIHVNATAIEFYRPDAAIAEIATAQSARGFKRGQAAFQPESAEATQFGSISTGVTFDRIRSALKSVGIWQPL